MALRNNKQKRCCVLDCPSNIINKNCKFYKFPTDFDSCQKWKFALKLIGTISDEHHVCEAHFGDDDFIGANGKPKSKKQLKKDAQPTLNLPREHTYMKFGNPKRGRVTKAKVVKKQPTVKMVERRPRPPERSGCNGVTPTTSSASAMPMLTTRVLTKTAAATTAALPPPPPLATPPHYAYVPRTGGLSNPWRISEATVCQDPLSMPTNKAQDPLALFPGIPAARTANSNAALDVPYMVVPSHYKGEIPRLVRPQHDAWNHSDSPQETTSTTLTLAQKILDEAVTKVEIACKEIEDAITVNEQFTIPSEATEKITIQTQDAKVMELLLVKNNPKISNQVNEEFKIIDKLIDNAQAALNSHNLNSIYPVHHKSTQTDKSRLEDENKRLKMEILSLKWKIDKMEKESPKEPKMQRKVVLFCKEGGSPFKRPPMSPFKKSSMSPPKKAAMSPAKKPPPPPPAKSPFKRAGTSPPTQKPKTSPVSVSSKFMKTYSLPKIISVTSLNAATAETAEPVAVASATSAATPTPSTSLNDTQVVDLTD